MGAVIERGLFPRQPPRMKLSADQRLLPSHVVNLAGVRPTSDVRRRQLVQAQRRSREKARLIARVATPVLPPPRHASDSAHQTYRRALATRFLEYLALVTQFTKAQCPPTPLDLFTDDVECNGGAGRRSVDEVWLTWTALYPGYELTVESTDVVASQGRATMALGVNVTMTFPPGSTVLKAAPVHVPSNANICGVVAATERIVVQFDLASGSIWSLQTLIGPHQAVQRVLRRAAAASSSFPTGGLSKLSVHYILNTF